MTALTVLGSQFLSTKVALQLPYPWYGRCVTVMALNVIPPIALRKHLEQPDLRIYILSACILTFSIDYFLTHKSQLSEYSPLIATKQKGVGVLAIHLSATFFFKPLTVDQAIKAFLKKEGVKLANEEIKKRRSFYSFRGFCFKPTNESISRSFRGNITLEKVFKDGFKSSGLLFTEETFYRVNPTFTQNKEGDWRQNFLVSTTLDLSVAAPYSHNYRYDTREECFIFVIDLVKAIETQQILTGYNLQETEYGLPFIPGDCIVCAIPIENSSCAAASIETLRLGEARFNPQSKIKSFNEMNGEGQKDFEKLKAAVESGKDLTFSNNMYGSQCDEVERAPLM